MISRFTALFFLIDLTYGWSSCEIQNPSSLSLHIKFNNLLHCSAKCVTSNCDLRMRVMHETTPNMTLQVPGYTMAVEPGLLLMLCHKTENLHGEDFYQWMTKIFQFKYRQLKALTSRLTGESSSVLPRLSLSYNNKTSQLDVTCTVVYSLTQSHKILLFRILSNEKKIDVKTNPREIMGSLINDNRYVNLTIRHTVVYGPDYYQNKFLCVVVDEHISNSSSLTDVLTYEREMDSDLIIELDNGREILPVNAQLPYPQKFLESSHLNCKDDMGVPAPTMSWTDSLNQAVNSSRWKLSFTFTGSRRYCCHATQKLSYKTITRKQCVHINIPAHKPLYPRDCAEIKQGTCSHSGSGVYTIHPHGDRRTMRVYCDMETDGQQWIVIQRRFNGIQSFAQNWYSYKYGFGQLEREFWLGNKHIHELSRTRSMKIRFDLWKPNSIHGYAEYSTFSVGSEYSGYRLRIAGYSGTARDCMVYCHNLNGMKFSTYDRDNDQSSRSCSRSRGMGGWWFKSCSRASLNGVYHTPGENTEAGLFWYYWTNGFHSLKQTEMKVRFL